ncbi:uncharacterized protein LOC113856604 isoform X3 [Abrus precatorius]|uniref:Uncharacterized protein LOC113856604 isoform X3 n=1 Tax=Abrus precatorius TaxID=3816 RepID=A0A8B8KKI5_ABRPR|nr:uncharacterized protein LOC113856604 isoform X3 [Abrus precatorius]
MEELLELQSEEVKLSMEKNKKRRLKTPAQVMALEKFYNDHKYPTEEMKSTLADELELTEKQVSGWFCHRRLKDKRLLNDEVGANGRQDRSSGVIQDRGSGLGQDSCGSTKHCDYRFLDPKEVESRDIYNTEFSAVDMTYGQRTHYPEDDSATDNKSFESSLSLQEWFPQEQDPYDMGPSRFPIPSGPLPPPNPKVAKNMGNKPSGYLKVKGEMEHAAITSVKKQLGKHYRENGPLLTVEFDTIPLGAFECHIADPANEPNNVANPIYPNSPDISALKRLSDLSSEEKFKGDRKVKKQNHDSDAVRTLSNEMMVTKRAKVDLLQHYDVQEAPVAEMEPRKSQRYTAEMPYSISEDETAETGSSID